jgi:outer membrane beta-barrel protein
VLARDRGLQALWIAAALVVIAAPARAGAQAAPAGAAGSPLGTPSPRAVAPASEEAPPSRPSDAPVPSCLDQSIVDQLGQSLRPRGVQERDFLKRGQIEVVARGGLLAGDLMSSSYLWGGSLAFFLTEDLALEASFDVTSVQLDLDRPLAEFTGDRQFDGGRGYLALGGLLWSPIHAKLKIGRRIVHADILLAAGAGRLFHDSSQGIAFDGGLLLELLLSQWVTLRVDLRDLVHVQEAVAETRLANNILLTGGLGLWLPTGW